MLIVTSYSSDEDEESSNQDLDSNYDDNTQQFIFNPPKPESMMIANFNMYLDTTLTRKPQQQQTIQHHFYPQDQDQDTIVPRMMKKSQKHQQEEEK